MRFELMNMRRLALMLGVCGGLLCVAPATAQNFPEKNITLLHAYSPGSSSAVLLRALADAASKTLGKKIIVEDRPGAGGALAPSVVHNTGKPDGYLLTQMPQPILRIPHIQKTEFDVINDFTWIIRVVDYTYALIVRNESPYRNINDFVTIQSEAIVQIVRSVYAAMHGRITGSLAPYPRSERRSDPDAVSIDRTGSAVDGTRKRARGATVQGQPQFEQTALQRWVDEEDPLAARGLEFEAWRATRARRQDAQAYERGGRGD